MADAPLSLPRPRPCAGARSTPPIRRCSQSSPANRGCPGVRLRRRRRDARSGSGFRDSAGARRDPCGQRSACGGHIITGPVAVAGAAARRHARSPGRERSSSARTGAIAAFARWPARCPRIFPSAILSHIPIDRASRTCRLPWGTELTLAPFFGVMGVAPPPAYGTISTIQPREHGGNLDNKELGEGSTLFLPVWAEGALFSAGDGHGVQGDGEVCINALEICLTGTFTPDAAQGRRRRRRRCCATRAAETATPFHQHGHERGSRPRDEAGACAR